MTKIYKANNIKAAVASSLPDANQTGMANGGICTIQGSNSWYYRTFLQYDLSGIPINSTILSAKMYIYCRSQNDNAAKNGTTNISRVTSDWNEATLSWNKQPTFTGSYLPKNVSPPSVGTWGEWDITSLVNEWYTKQYPNYGLYYTAFFT